MSARQDKQEIEQRVAEQFAGDARVDSSKIKVAITDDKVMLTGTVPSHFSRLAALDGAAAVCGERDVEDRLAIEYPTGDSAPADEAVRTAVESIIAWLPDVDVREGAVYVADGVVNIEGCVDAMWKKGQVGEAIRNLYGVLDIDNKLAVVPSGKHSDEDIALRIEAALDRRDVVPMESITIEVTDGIVTLTGWVPSGHAKRVALEAASHSAGVVNVVNKLTVKRQSTSA